MGSTKTDPGTLFLLYAFLLITVLLFMLLTAKLGGLEETEARARLIGGRVRDQVLHDWERVRAAAERHLGGA